MTDQEIINKNRKRVNKEIKDFNDEFDDQYMTPDEKNEKFIEELVKLVSSHPKIEKRIIEEYEKKKNKKRDFISTKFIPYLVVGGLALGSIGGALVQKQRDKNTNISFNSSYEVKYHNIEEAPLEIKKAYVDDQIKKYEDAVLDKPELADEDMTKTIRAYRTSKLGGDNRFTDYDDIFTAINNLTIIDPVDETVPFQNTKFNGSIVGDDGSVYVPVTEEDQITEKDTLKTYNGNLFKRGM